MLHSWRARDILVEKIKSAFPVGRRPLAYLRVLCVVLGENRSVLEPVRTFGSEPSHPKRATLEIHSR